jgi:L-lactate dehydrogenase complex protein LldG
VTRDDIIGRFMDNGRQVGAEIARVSGPEELREALERLLSGAESIYCPQITDTERNLDLPLERLTREYRHASASVEEVSGGIAETGSLVCSSRDGRAVQGGLLPPHHIALVAAENIFETLDDLFESLGTAPPTNVVLETGPSRTADIELTLTIGVHGPERLSILVVG